MNKFYYSFNDLEQYKSAIMRDVMQHHKGKLYNVIDINGVTIQDCIIKFTTETIYFYHKCDLVMCISYDDINSMFYTTDKRVYSYERWK